MSSILSHIRCSSWIPCIDIIYANDYCSRLSAGKPVLKDTSEWQPEVLSLAESGSALSHLSYVLNCGSVVFFVHGFALVFVQFIRAHSATEISFIKSVIRESIFSQLLYQWLWLLCVISSSARLMKL